jgi:transglutaminase-like putative cysteine protease
MGGTTASAGQRALRIFCISFPVLLVLWVVLVLYPNPLKLPVSLHRLASPQVDPGAVESLAASLPSEPADIEKAVLEMLPYRYDWQAYSMPWYYPTVSEALDRGQGDCKGRAIVLASVLEAKGIPYQVNSSPTHVWVDYPGKQQNSAENPDVGLYGVDPDTGARSFHFPRISVVNSFRIFWRGFWTPMPVLRKVLLLSGPAVLAAARVLWPRMQAASAQGGEVSPPGGGGL